MPGSAFRLDPPAALCYCGRSCTEFSELDAELPTGSSEIRRSFGLLGSKGGRKAGGAALACIAFWGGAAMQPPMHAKASDTTRNRMKSTCLAPFTRSIDLTLRQSRPYSLPLQQLRPPDRGVNFQCSEWFRRGYTRS